MCEASVYVVREDREELVLESVDRLEADEGRIRLISLFGEEKILTGRIKALSLVNHKIFIEPL